MPYPTYRPTRHLSETAAANPEHPARKRRSKRRLLLYAGLILLGLAALAGFALFHLWSSLPTAWGQATAQLDQLSTEEKQALSDAFEKRFVGELSTHSEYADGDAVRQALTSNRPTPPLLGDIRTLRVGLDEINAYLETHLPRLLENQGTEMPPEIDRILVGHRDGRPLVMVHIKADQIDQVFTFDLDIAVHEQEPDTLRIRSVEAGQLPLPRDRVRQEIAALPALEDNPEAAAFLDDLFTGRQLPAVIDVIDDDFAAELIGFTIDPNGMQLTRRIVPAPSE
ncbi:MAG: hypothetical protein AAF797_14695 [Planctomycetota bacterium]